ncbi:MAG: hypothetical protein H6672_10755 [Anaerolineaceae bacterium]|nr:hypothetical protein [Anaerolineaceae bacterium]
MRVVEVHQPGRPIMVLAANDTLAGGDILPGLVVPVQDSFSEESAPEGE